MNVTFHKPMCIKYSSQIIYKEYITLLGYSHVKGHMQRFRGNDIPEI